MLLLLFFPWVHPFCEKCWFLILIEFAVIQSSWNLAIFHFTSKEKNWGEGWIRAWFVHFCQIRTALMSMQTNSNLTSTLIWKSAIFRLETMKIVNQLCEGYGQSCNGISKLFKDLYADAAIYDAIINIGPYFKDTFIYCKFLDKWMDCGKIFAPFISEVGLCYSFNSIALRELLTNE